MASYFSTLTPNPYQCLSHFLTAGTQYPTSKTLRGEVYFGSHFIAWLAPRQEDTVSTGAWRVTAHLMANVSQQAECQGMNREGRETPQVTTPAHASHHQAPAPNGRSAVARPWSNPLLQRPFLEAHETLGGYLDTTTQQGSHSILFISPGNFHFYFLLPCVQTNMCQSLAMSYPSNWPDTWDPTYHHRFTVYSLYRIHVFHLNGILQIAGVTQW